MNPVTPIRSLFITLAVIATPMALATAPATGAPAATSTVAACATPWASTAESNPRMNTHYLTNVRTGQHTCFDRLVLDFRGRAPGYFVKYVRNVRMEGSGSVVPLRGAAKLMIVAKAPAYKRNGAPSYVPADPTELSNVSGFRTFRQVAWAGSFEGQTTIGLGVRARLPFRVFTTFDANRVGHLVIDVAHTW